jgi:hypothetical protein
MLSECFTAPAADFNGVLKMENKKNPNVGNSLKRHAAMNEVRTKYYELDNDAKKEILEELLMTWGYLLTCTDCGRNISFHQKHEYVVLSVAPPDEGTVEGGPKGPELLVCCQSCDEEYTKQSQSCGMQ